MKKCFKKKTMYRALVKKIMANAAVKNLFKKGGNKNG